MKIMRLIIAKQCFHEALRWLEDALDFEQLNKET